MNPNKLDSRISIEALSGTLDTNGQRTDVWTTRYASIPANVAPSGGREFLRASRVFETASAVFMIRYRTGITQQQRVLHEGKRYNILAIDQLGRRDGLLITAQAINNQNEEA